MMKRKAIIFISIAMMLASCANFRTTNYIEGNELSKLLVGNTEIGQYQHKGYDVKFAQHYSDNGKITGGGTAGPYEGTYEIREDGCFYTDMHDQTGYADGCNYYSPLGGEQYRVHGPYESVTDVMIKPGNVLNEQSW